MDNEELYDTLTENDEELRELILKAILTAPELAGVSNLGALIVAAYVGCEELIRNPGLLKGSGIHDR